MVDPAKIDVTMSTIAVVTVPWQQPISIDQKGLERVLAPPLSVGQSLEGLLVSSQRDQIEAIAGGSKVNVRDLSGRQAFSQSKIPSVLDFLIHATASQITSYGLNFLIRISCAKPSQWIRDNILSSQISEKTGRAMLGGAASLKTMVEPKTWNIKLEPVDDETMVVDFNAHEETKQLPSQDKLRQELQEQFNALLTFLNDLGL